MFDAPRTLAALGLLLVLAAPAQAQNAPVSGFNPTTSAVSEEKLLGALRQVTGTVTIPDGKSAVLIQPDGQAWRDWNRSTLPVLATIATLGMLVVLGVFYVRRGRIAIAGGPSGRSMLRFSFYERFVHWITAGSFVVLGLTGLNIAVGRYVILPVIGPQGFYVLSDLGKVAHNYLAFPFTLGLVLMFLTWVGSNIPKALDIEWFRQGGGLIGAAHPPSEKFNGGQKLVFWIVVLGGSIVALSGFLLMFPFSLTDIAGMQLAQLVHGILALLMIAAMIAHIYIGTLGMEGAFDAMGTGVVDENWARAHHSLWAEKELAKVRQAAE